MWTGCFVCLPEHCTYLPWILRYQSLINIKSSSQSKYLLMCFELLLATRTAVMPSSAFTGLPQTVIMAFREGHFLAAVPQFTAEPLLEYRENRAVIACTCGCRDSWPSFGTEHEAALFLFMVSKWWDLTASRSNTACQAPAFTCLVLCSGISLPDVRSYDQQRNAL